MEIQSPPMQSAEAQITKTHYQTTIRSAGHNLIADEPVTANGTDLGMSPYSLLLASLGSCTAITLRMYAFKGDITEEQHARLITIANACPVHKILTGTIEVKTS